MSPRPSSAAFLLTALLVALALFAGLGLRDPSPPDEPRFVLAAQHMVASGDWMFPRRGSELYAEKPPTFMWLQAASYTLVRDWRLAFLLPSWLAAMLALALAWDLARRLWGRDAAWHAALALFVCVQFGLQAKRAQIDMVLVAMTTLSLYALCRYILLQRDWRWLALGTFAAGLGTVTKGVGFLPLLLCLPWWIVRGRCAERAGRTPRPWLHALAGVAGFVAGAGVWLVPMLAAVHASADPALHAYAREMLLKQTGTRYANAWHHLKPAWYYLQVVATLWLPGALLLPWLLPAWWRRLRRRDPRFVLLLGWSVLVLVFFSLSPGKREVYIFPALPALCIAAGPLLHGLLRRRGVARVLAGWLALLAVAGLGFGAALLAGPPAALLDTAARRGIDGPTLHLLGLWLLAFGVVVAAIVAWSRLRRAGTGVVLATAALWATYGLGLLPALDADSSARALMHDVGARIGPDAQLGLLAWREQHLLQADRAAVDFGFKRSWQDQWRAAGPWLAAAPGRRWLFVLEEALGPCVERAGAQRVGQSNRRTWWLVPGTAMRPDCDPAATAGVEPPPD